MKKSTTNNVAANKNEIGWKLVDNTVPIGPGVAHGKTYMKPFIPKISMNNLPIITLATGAKQNGTKKYGFKMIGAANSNGSLTANMTGIIEALPTAFSCLERINKMKIIGTINVAPVPPNSPMKFPKFSVNE